jgi:acetoin:2,6-dichlorophenolindophenol oxidoreductase subunit alpha
MNGNSRANRPDELEWLRLMITIRQFEQRAEQLIDRGEVIGVMHSSAGQEAVCVGACAALRKDDYITGNHRSHGHPIAKGAGLDRLMAELMGRSTGVCKGMGGSMHLADFSIGSLGESAIVGSALGIAVGAGLSIQMAKRDNVCLAFFGDGAANAGICHEAMNLAAVWKLPVIFLCENNRYAMTTPFEQTVAIPQVADRAKAYGFEGVVVDGQDVRAVHDAVSAAAQDARQGKGPTLVEAMTYRYGDHSYKLGSLSGTRDDSEYWHWKERDPIEIHAGKLIEEGSLGEARRGELWDQVAAELDRAVAFARESPYPEPGDLWGNMYVDVGKWDKSAWPN